MYKRSLRFLFTHNGSLQVFWFVCAVTSLNLQTLCKHLSLVGCRFFGPCFGRIAVGYLSLVNPTSHRSRSEKHLLPGWKTDLKWTLNGLTLVTSIHTASLHTEMQRTLDRRRQCFRTDVEAMSKNFKGSSYLQISQSMRKKIFYEKKDNNCH